MGLKWIERVKRGLRLGKGRVRVGRKVRGPKTGGNLGYALSGGDGNNATFMSIRRRYTIPRQPGRGGNYERVQRSTAEVG